MSDVWKSQKIIVTAVMIDFTQHTPRIIGSTIAHRRRPTIVARTIPSSLKSFLVCPLDETTAWRNLSGHKNDPINDPINLLSEVEKNVLQIVRKHPGISRINIIPITGKSEATVKRALKTLGDMGFVEYRGSNKTGGYFSLWSLWLPIGNF